MDEVAAILLADVQPVRAREQGAQRRLLERADVPRTPVEKRLFLADQDARPAQRRARGREPRIRVRIAVDPERLVPVREDLPQDIPVRALAVPALDSGPRGA